MMNTLLNSLPQVRIRFAFAAAILAVIAIAATSAAAQDSVCLHCDPQSMLFTPSWVQQFPATSPSAAIARFEEVQLPSLRWRQGPGWL